MWLEENKLMKLLPTLNDNNIVILSHLTDLLKNESDVDEFINNKLQNTKFMLKKKFKKNVLKTLVNKPIPNNGVNIASSIKREYIIPELKENEYTFRGGNGYNKHMVSILKTTRTLNNNFKVTIETMSQKLGANENHKIILVCGKTGTGKTTLINSMMNYIYDVKQTDKFRMKLIVENIQNRDNSDSITDHISSYTIT
eukprot:77625_1